MKTKIKSVKKSQKKKMPDKKSFIIMAAVILALGAVYFFTVYNVTPGDNTTIAWIYNEPISLGEFRHELTKNYSSVLSQAVRAGGIQGKGFWRTVIKENKQTPVTMLKKAALDSSVHRKTILLWAREYGLINNLSYENFLKEFNKENIRRKNAMSAGDPVYGPEQFTQNVYYDLVLSELEFELKKKLIASFTVDEEKIQRLYDEEYRPKYYHPGRTILDCAGVPNENEDSRRIINAVLRAVTAGEDVKTAAERFGAEYRSQGINLMRMPGMGLPVPIQDAAYALDKDEVSQVLEISDYFWIVKCVERELASYLSYDQTKPIIIEDLHKSEYNRELERRKASGVLKINKRVYNKINEKFIMTNGSRNN